MQRHRNPRTCLSKWKSQLKKEKNLSVAAVDAKAEKTKDCTINAKTEKTKDGSMSEKRHRKKENISIAEVDAKTEKTKDSEVW